MARTVLVTGVAGFIGSHLARTLAARGERVVGVDNFDPFYDEARKRANLATIDARALRFLECDIRDRALVELAAEERPEAIVHLAALAGVRPSIAEPARYVSVNVDGTVNVLEAARVAGCRTVLFGSSSSVYGNNRKVPFAEADAVDEPISPYAATKRAGELICHAYCHLFGLTIACLRFFTVYGPAQRPDLAISAFMRAIAQGRAVTMFGDGRSSRDYTYVDDIVEGILAAGRWADGRSAGTFRIFNLGGAHPVALADMIEAIAAVVGKPARVERQPMQPGDVERTFADLARSRAELSFEPKVPFAEGLARQWAWMRAAEAHAPDAAHQRLR